MEIKFVGIVLSNIDYREKDKLVNIFSVSDGLVLGKLKSVKGASSKLKVLASPFCLAEFTAVKAKDKMTITGGEVIDTFFDITSDIEKYFVGCCILDFERKLIANDNELEKHFKLLVSVLKSLSYSEENAKLVLIKYLLEVLAISGFALNFECCSACKNKLNENAFIDIIDGSIKCGNCVGQKCITVSREEKVFLNQVINKNDSIKLNYDKEKLNAILKLLGNYVYCQFDYILKLEEILKF